MESSIGFGKKLLIVLLVVAVGFTCGTSVTTLYARHHRHAGVDYPYDSSAYYSLTRIDYADGAPSRFALNDLSGNGTVFDYTRLIKTILYGDMFPKWQNYVKEKWGIDLKRWMALDEKTQQQAQEDYQKISGNIFNRKTTTIDPKIFEMDGMKGSGNVSYDQKVTQLQTADQIYEGAASNAVQTMSTEAQVYATLYRALNASNNAEGETQARQAGENITALKNLAIAMVSETLADRTNMKQTAAALETAEKEQHILSEANNLHTYFFDPYDPDDRAMLDSLAEQTNFKLYESKGMPDF